MNQHQLIIGLLITLPLAGAIICTLRGSTRFILRINVTVAALEMGVAIIALYCVHDNKAIFAFHDHMFIDALSSFHLLLVSIIFFLSSLYAFPYFAFEQNKNGSAIVVRKRHGILWNAFFAMLVAALCSNNMGILWITIEASTLFSALLIQIRGKPASIEAMWKYLLICSVGIALAFVGTLLLSVASQAANLPGEGSILWSVLVQHAALLNHDLVLASFLFIIVGFGTKAGLAPMHTWLPDAHSQAHTPVSAVFSGVMLNVALYCILRYLPIIDFGQNMEGHRLLLGFGLGSLVIASIFIPAQHDIKRLLAYCSVEHIGIMAIGFGLGGAGTVAALFHIVNHSFSKTLAFFSAGRLAQHYGTHDMRSMQGAGICNPLWGTGFLLSVLVLVGMAPFSVFMSEFQIVKTAVDNRQFTTLGILLVTVTIIFISMLKHSIHVSFGVPGAIIKSKSIFIERSLMVFLFAVLLAGGLYVPAPVLEFFSSIAVIINSPVTTGGLP